MRYADESRSDFVHRILGEKGFGVEHFAGPRRTRVHVSKPKEVISSERESLRNDMAERDRKRWDEQARAATIASLEAGR